MYLYCLIKSYYIYTLIMDRITSEEYPLYLQQEPNPTNGSYPDGPICHALYKIHPCTEYFLQGKSTQGNHCLHSHYDQDRSLPKTLQIQPYNPSAAMTRASLTPLEYQRELENYFTESVHHPVAKQEAFYGENESAFDLYTFKTTACKIIGPHDYKQCNYYHSYKDRRRNPIIYASEKCKYYETEYCPLGENCPKSHNTSEKFYTFEKYKTRMCGIQFTRKKCNFERICCFAHTEEELTIFPIHHLPSDKMFYMFYFKTTWCPLAENHNRALCVYAHNWQDFRRRPHLFKYINKLCPNWKYNNFLGQYEDGCPLKASCQYSHGWKEMLFHPFEYKSNPCPYGIKCRMYLLASCPYYHTAEESRKFGSAIAYPMTQLPKLNPNANINDYVEMAYQPGFFPNADLGQLHYTYFEEDTEKFLSQSSIYNQSEIKQNAKVQVSSLKADASVPNDNIKLNSFPLLQEAVCSGWSVFDDLYKILTEASLLRYYLKLRDSITNRKLYFLVQLTNDDLYKMGMSVKEDREKLLTIISKAHNMK